MLQQEGSQAAGNSSSRSSLPILPQPHSVRRWLLSPSLSSFLKALGDTGTLATHCSPCPPSSALPVLSGTHSPPDHAALFLTGTLPDLLFSVHRPAGLPASQARIGWRISEPLSTALSASQHRRPCFPSGCLLAADGPFVGNGLRCIRLSQAEPKLIWRKVLSVCVVYLLVV